MSKPEPAARFNAKSGALEWRGFYRSPADMERQAAEFERVLAGDWFAPASLAFAAECRAALAEYEAYYAEETDVA